MEILNLKKHYLKVKKHQKKTMLQEGKYKIIRSGSEKISQNNHILFQFKLET